MGKRRIGLIRVLTTPDTKLLNLHGELVMKYFPSFDVVSQCIPDQPEGIHDERTEKIAAPKVLALAETMERSGMEACDRGWEVSCFSRQDTGAASRSIGTDA